MAYITQQDLEEELGRDKLVQLTDDESTGEVNAKAVERAIAFAEGTFESYARTRYTLPVPVTAKVKGICVDLAVYRLKRNRASTPDATKNLKESLHDPSIKYLEALQSGRAALDIPAVEETATSPANPDRVLKGSSKQVFTDDKLSTY